MQCAKRRDASRRRPRRGWQLSWLSPNESVTDCAGRAKQRRRIRAHRTRARLSCHDLQNWMHIGARNQTTGAPASSRLKVARTTERRRSHRTQSRLQTGAPVHASRLPTCDTAQRGQAAIEEGGGWRIEDGGWKGPVLLGSRSHEASMAQIGARRKLLSNAKCIGGAIFCYSVTPGRERGDEETMR